jgi:4-diphosphocytidyl-2-C-methyl-D-erythritol kinase
VNDPLGRLAPVVRLAPAKLNLTLAVVGRRPDGYHALHTIMAPVGLADRLSVAPSAVDHDTLRVEGRDAGPAGDNLVLRAIAAARTAARPRWPAAPATPPFLAARLEKHIPVAAGLAGGSSDAAAALDAALEAWGAELPHDERERIAASIGSDVPFFLAGGLALVEGRGERVTRLGTISGPPPGLLIVTPEAHVSTPAVFAAYDAGARPASAGAARLASEHFAAELRGGISSRALLDRAGILASANDLLPAAIAVLPDLQPFRRALARVLGRPIGLSGSGPTCWAVYASLDEAVFAATKLEEAIAAGRLVAPGAGPPFVAAITLEGGQSS